MVNVGAEEQELAEFLAGLVVGAEAKPVSGIARGRLAMAYHANGFTEEAITTYAQAQALQTEEFRWPYFRALLLADSGDAEGALESLGHAIENDPSYMSAWLWRGSLYLDLGATTAAEGDYLYVLGRAEGEAQIAAATVGLARVNIRAGRAEEAIELLEQITEHTDHPYVFGILSRAYRAAGRDDDARDAAANAKFAAPLEWPDELRTSLSGYIRGFSGRLSHAETLIRRGEPDAALEILESLRLRLPADRTVLNNLAVAHSMTGRHELALNALSSALAEHNDYYMLHFNIAMAYENMGKHDAALNHIQQALNLQPGLMQAHEFRMYLLMREDRHDELLVALRDAERHGQPDSAVLFRAGLIEGERGKWPEAIRRFGEAVGRDPEFVKGHLFLARSLAEDGRLDEARQALARAATQGASPAAVADARARLDHLDREQR